MPKCRTCRKGAVSILKVITGRDATDPRERMQRLEQCDRCEHRKWPLCAKCHCIIAAKVRLKSEKCPEGKWKVRSSPIDSRDR